MAHNLCINSIKYLPNTTNVAIHERLYLSSNSGDVGREEFSG